MVDPFQQFYYYLEIRRILYGRGYAAHRTDGFTFGLLAGYSYFLIRG
jgi:hypothetical protein